MQDTFDDDRERITIAILALGGQGGGVLSDWLQDVANRNGWTAQGTSVPGVAQRTGSTVYYIEMVRKAPAEANRRAPVLAMMPVPGDVDVVIASELMEGGRAILRGFVDENRTTLISSNHRIYAISEKSAMGSGLNSSQRILEAGERRAKHFINFDMEAASVRSGAAISAVMLGAVAGSGVLPFTRDMFEDAIRHGKKAVSINLKGFDEGARQARVRREEIIAAELPPEPTTDVGKALHRRIVQTVPEAAQSLALVGVKRLMDYQDSAYADLYLDRLQAVSSSDNGSDGYRLTREVARHLALWMAYEDTIRVADLKIRASRLARIQEEAGTSDNELMTVTEYMHPRLREVCETLPANLGRTILDTAWLRRLLEPLLHKGRHVETTSLRWFAVLRFLAGLRWMRRSTLRYLEEQHRIETWLALVVETAATDCELAAEVAATQRLIKGYGDTFERGLTRFQTIMSVVAQLVGTAEAADRVRQLRDAALADDRGDALAATLKKFASA